MLAIGHTVSPYFAAAQPASKLTFGNQPENSNLGRDLAQVFFADDFVKQGNQTRWTILITSPREGMTLVRDGDRIIVSYNNAIAYLDRDGNLTGQQTTENLISALSAILSGYYLAEPGFQFQVPNNLPDGLDKHLNQPQ